jgi:hypothetical protein
MERDGLGGGYRTQWSLEGSDGNEKVAVVLPIGLLRPNATHKSTEDMSAKASLHVRHAGFPHLTRQSGNLPTSTRRELQRFNKPFCREGQVAVP